MLPFYFCATNTCLNRTQYESITKVDEIHTGPLRARTKAGRRAASESCNTRIRVKNSDLPQGTLNDFTSKVLPLAFQLAGVLGPWESIDDNNVISIWNLAFDSHYPIASGDVKGDLFLTVKTLVRRHPIYYSLVISLTSFSQVKRGISSWLHRFAMAAEKALITEFEHQGLITLEDKAEFVQFLLGDAEDILSKHRPFLWKSAYDRDSPNSDRFQVCCAHIYLSLFTNHILLRVYSKGVWSHENFLSIFQ